MLSHFEGIGAYEVGLLFSTDFFWLHADVVHTHWVAMDISLPDLKYGFIILLYNFCIQIHVPVEKVYRF